MRKYLATTSVCLALALASVSQAATMSVSDQVLLPNTPNQIVNIYGSGGETIVGLQLGVNIVPNGTEGPVITDLKITGSGTLLGDITQGASVGAFPGNPRLWGADALAQEGMSVVLTPNLPLAIVTVDTTGIFAGPQAKNFLVNLNPAQNNSTYLIPILPGDLQPLFSNGNLIIAPVPEPATVVLAGLGGIALVVIGARRSRKS
jgi:hypothetical protein